VCVCSITLRRCASIACNLSKPSPPPPPAHTATCRSDRPLPWRTSPAHHAGACLPAWRSATSPIARSSGRLKASAEAADFFGGGGDGDGYGAGGLPCGRLHPHGAQRAVPGGAPGQARHTTAPLSRCCGLDDALQSRPRRGPIYAATLAASSHNLPPSRADGCRPRSVCEDRGAGELHACHRCVAASSAALAPAGLRVRQGQGLDTGGLHQRWA